MTTINFLWTQEVRYPSGPTALLLDLESVESVFVPRENPNHSLVRTRSGRYHTLPMSVGEFGSLLKTRGFIP